MRSELLSYYEAELSSLRQAGVEFGHKYPKIASRLVLEPDKCDDPHVERLLEAFAFLCARVQLKLDDDFPLITESLLEVLYPDFLRPIPSMSIAEFQLDSESGSVTTPVHIERGARLYSRPVNGVPCKFRTAQPTELLPLAIESAELITPERIPVRIPHTGCPAAIRIQMRGPAAVPLPQLNVDCIRLFLNGESSLVHDIYELLNWNVSRVVVAGITHHTLGAACLKPVGFDADEAILDYSQRSFPAYRLLQEYFAFPEKFLFYDLCGLAGAWAKAGAEDRADIYLLLDAAPAAFQQQRLERGINRAVFQLNCVPIVNLFEQTCEPISLNHRTFEYPVIPDVRRPMATEVHSIHEVLIGEARSSDFQICEPFYSPNLHSRAASGKSAHWTLYRRPSSRPDDAGTDVLLSIVNSEQKPAVIEDGTVTVRAICTNRDLPSRLPFGNATGDFELDASAPVSRIVALKKPTATLRPPGGPGSLWNLTSHLSLNYLSLVGKEGAGALRALLRLCDFERSASSRSVVAGIAEVRSAPHYAPLQAPHGLSFVRGTRIELDFDEEKFVGRGVWLFASILERFFAQYCSLNSFTQFSAKVLQQKEVVREWKPRSGHRLLV